MSLFLTSFRHFGIIYFIHAFCSRFLLVLYILLSSLNPVVIERSWRQNLAHVQVKNVATFLRSSVWIHKARGSRWVSIPARLGSFRSRTLCVCSWERPTALQREIPQACSHFLLRWCYPGQGLCVYHSASPFQELLTFLQGFEDSRIYFNFNWALFIIEWLLYLQAVARFNKNSRFSHICLLYTQTHQGDNQSNESVNWISLFGWFLWINW